MELRFSSLETDVHGRKLHSPYHYRVTEPDGEFYTIYHIMERLERGKWVSAGLSLLKMGILLIERFSSFPHITFTLQTLSFLSLSPVPERVQLIC